MATRNSYYSDGSQADDTFDPSQYDPSLVMNTPLPDAPATPTNAVPGGEQTPITPVTPPPPPPPPPAPVDTSSAVVNTTPGWVAPPPGPNASAPRPSVNPTVVYTDTSGNGYDPPALAAAWASNPAFRNDPINARVPDILAAYGFGSGSTAAAAPAAPAGGSSAPGGTFSPSVGFALPDTGLGNTVDTGLTSLINNNGMTPEQTSLLAQVNGIIGAGGALPSDQTLEQQQLETARENEASAFGGQLSDARDELANRGLVGEPGAPQGSEGEAIQNITRTTAPAYAQAVRDVSTSQIQTQNARLTSAIATATGLTNDAAGNLVASLGTGSQRQVALAGIALDSLSQNMQWNEFLANYGLSRDQLLNSIQSGNIGALTTLLSLFQQTAGVAAGGHI